MSIFQGKKLNTIIERINTLPKINKYFFQKTQNPSNPQNPENVKKEKLDEILNILKLKQHLLSQKYTSFHIKLAPNTYYTWTLTQRQNFLQAHSLDHLCKTIILKNTKFENSLKSKFYQKFICVIIQYTKSLNNEKLIKTLKKYQNENCEQKTSRKMYNFRLASEIENFEVSGFRHNAVMPFLLKKNVLVVMTGRLEGLEGGYFWLGGGHENVKLRVGYQEFLEKSEYDVLVRDIHSEKK